jgi:hypothetical protein
VVNESAAEVVYPYPIVAMANSPEPVTEAVVAGATVAVVPVAVP